MRRPAIVRARRVAGIAVIGTVVVAAGLVAGAGPAIGEQQAAATLSYDCAFPSGGQPVPVAVTATFPGMATPGTAIQPTDVAVSATLPAAAIADLRSLGANSTTADAALSVTVAQRGAAAPTSWPELLAPDTVLPADGPATLAFSATVPSATATGTGDVTFTAGALALRLSPTTAGGTATTPATVAVDCTPPTGQGTVFATVEVPAPAMSATPPATGGSGGTAPVISTPPRPGTTPKAAEPNATPPVDPNCPTTSPVPLVETAKIAGRSNLTKLGESVSLGDDGTIVLTSLGSGLTSQGDFLLCWTAQLTLPPVASTVLTFGFEPTSATMTLTQVGTMIVETWQHNGVPMATAAGHENLALSDVTVNGQPLDVGPHCRTSTPLAIDLSGIPPYQPLLGGPLEGVLTIPPLSGCGTTENLDPLLTAPLTGSGNLVRIIQGTPCSAFIPNCVPPPAVFH